MEIFELLFFIDEVYDSFKVDVEKEEDQYLITADLPGIDKENINLEIEEGVLTIAVNFDEEVEEEDEEKNFLHRERRKVNSSRRIRLNDFDEDNISANLEDGVLKISLPIAEEVSNKKSIAIE